MFAEHPNNCVHFTTSFNAGLKAEEIAALTECCEVALTGPNTCPLSDLIYSSRSAFLRASLR
jgi:hypothetical protein